MTRESRANLIFLALFLLISAPGIYLLVKKKSESGRAPLWLPVPARSSIVYIDPIDAPADIPRLTPALTANWVADLARDRAGTKSVPMRFSEDGRSEPVMTDSRLAQLVARQQTNTGLRVALLVWNLPREADAATFDLRAEQNLENLSVDEIAAERIEPPHAVKRDLQDSGIPAPPLWVYWVSGQIRSADPAAAIQLKITAVVDGRPFSDTLTLLER